LRTEAEKAKGDQNTGQQSQQAANIGGIDHRQLADLSQQFKGMQAELNAARDREQRWLVEDEKRVRERRAAYPWDAFGNRK
jgi:hypothetical protein